MSGHSKWATTKHKKAIIDSRRAKNFAKLIKAIEVSARAGGADVSGNPTLFDAIAKAKRYAEIFYETRLLEEIYSSEDGKIIYVTLSVRPQMGCDESKKVFIISAEDLSLIGIRDYKLKEVFYD